MKSPYTVAIVGGGMVGAVQALLLARAIPSITITLFERFESAETQGSAIVNRPSFDGRSTAISPTTELCLKDLALWPQLQPYVTAIQKISVSDKGHAGMATFDGSDNDGEPLGHVVMNQGLGAVLLAALAAQANIVNVTAEVQSIKPQAGAAQLRWQAQGEQECEGSFDLVIVADGAQSPLRQQLGIQVTTHDYGQHALVANIRHTQPHEGVAHERFTASGPVALLPLGGAASNESALVWTHPSNTIAQLKNATGAERLAMIQRHFGWRAGRFTAMSEPAYYPLSLILADEQVRSNIVLMGNAAHFLHPVAGQGFNLSVRDALRLTAVLVDAVAQNQSIGCLATLERYLTAQHKDQWNTVNISHAFNRIFGNQRLPVQLLRTLGVSALEAQPLARSLFIGLLSGRAQPKAAYSS